MAAAVEIEEIKRRYERRGSLCERRYAPTDPYVMMSEQEKDRVITSLLRTGGVLERINGCSLLEIGCGHGANLLRFLRLGFSADRIVGNELLPDRLEAAAANLPKSVRLWDGDATEIAGADDSFDVVCLFTVFSSVLCDDLQQRLARKAWALIRPSGGILWYDFTVNNPRNPDVRGVSVKRLRALFPETDPVLRRVTLAPPIGRFVTQWWTGGYSLLNRLPVLRSHVMGWLPKRV